MWYMLISCHLSGGFVATRSLTKFCAEESSKQKDSKISRTDQISNTETGFRPLYLFSIWHWLYPIKYMFSFWWKCLTRRRLQKHENLPRYMGATGDQTTAFLRRKILSNWELIYPIRYMASFQCGNTLLKGDFKA